MVPVLPEKAKGQQAHEELVKIPKIGASSISTELETLSLLSIKCTSHVQTAVYCSSISALVLFLEVPTSLQQGVSNHA
jgi:hypothetical protein